MNKADSQKPTQSLPKKDAKLFATIMGIVGVGWLLGVLLCGWSYITHWATDRFGQLMFVICLFLFASAVFGALMRNRIDKKTALRLMGVHALAVVLWVINIGGNLAVRHRENATAQWLATIPDYSAMFPEKTGILRRPGRGGYLAPNLDIEVVGDRPFKLVRATTNNWGFYGAEDIGDTKPDGTYRILMLGDSFVSGYRVDVENSWTTLIEDELNRRAAAGEFEGYDRVEVLPANIETYHPAWWLLENHGDTLQPDAVVFASCIANDFLQSVQMFGIRPDPPFSEFVWGRGQIPVLTNEEALTPALEIATEKYFSAEVNPYPEYAFRAPRTERTEHHRRQQWGAPSRASSRWPIGRVIQNIFLARKMENGYPGFTYAPLESDPVFWSGDTATFLIDQPRPYHVAYQVAERSVSNIAIWCQERSIPFVMIAIPHPVQVVPQDYNNTFVDSGLDEEAFDVMQPNERLEEWTTRGEGHYIDLVDLFGREDPMTRQHFLPAGDIHWRPSGHVKAAEFTAPKLAEIFAESLSVD